MKDLNKDSTMKDVAEFVDWINHNIIKPRTNFWIHKFSIWKKPDTPSTELEKKE